MTACIAVQTKLNSQALVMRLDDPCPVQPVLLQFFEYAFQPLQLPRLRVEYRWAAEHDHEATLDVVYERVRFIVEVLSRWKISVQEFILAWIPNTALVKLDLFALTAPHLSIIEMDYTLLPFRLESSYATRLPHVWPAKLRSLSVSSLANETLIDFSGATCFLEVKRLFLNGLGLPLGIANAFPHLETLYTSTPLLCGYDASSMLHFMPPSSVSQWINRCTTLWNTVPSLHTIEQMEALGEPYEMDRTTPVSYREPDQLVSWSVSRLVLHNVNITTLGDTLQLLTRDALTSLTLHIDELLFVRIAVSRYDLRVFPNLRELRLVSTKHSSGVPILEPYLVEFTLPRSIRVVDGALLKQSGRFVYKMVQLNSKRALKRRKKTTRRGTRYARVRFAVFLRSSRAGTRKRCFGPQGT